VTSQYCFCSAAIFLCPSEFPFPLVYRGEALKKKGKLVRTIFPEWKKQNFKAIRFKLLSEGVPVLVV